MNSDKPSTHPNEARDGEKRGYRYEYGRRYHGYVDGKYQLPNDTKEMDRLELQHHIWSATIGRLYFSPLPKTISHALDLGCGTGNWVIEFALAHQTTQVTGIDLSAIQPDTHPPNCNFQVEDAMKPWHFTQPFDFIHTRAITFGISEWDGLVSQAFTALKPGGWIELQEFCLPMGCDDGSMSEGGKGGGLWKWGQEMHRATSKLGIDSLAAIEHPRRLRDRGFINIEEMHLKIPSGTWHEDEEQKKIGAMTQKDLAEGLEGLSTRLFLMLGYSQDELSKFLDEARKDLMDPSVHAYMPV